MRGKLKGRPGDFTFWNQHVIRGWIANFYCPAARLVIELDGSSHHDREAQDQLRDQVKRWVRCSGPCTLTAPRSTELAVSERHQAHLHGQRVLRPKLRLEGGTIIWHEGVPTTYDVEMERYGGRVEAFGVLVDASRQ